MKLLASLTVLVAAAALEVSAQSYSKSCFINYFLKNNFLDKSYEVHKNEKALDASCLAAVNSTVSRVRATSNDICISAFYRRKYVSESLVKQYLLPQFKNSQKQVHFDGRFETFLKKALNISAVICNNPDVFKPDLKALVKNGKLQQEAKTKEIQCLQQFIMEKKKPLSDECKPVVDAIKKQFYEQTEGDMKKVFAAPNNNLIDLKCTADGAKKNQLFERVFFFVVLATSRNMNDKQINALLKSAEIVIAGSTRSIFDCMV